MTWLQVDVLQLLFESTRHAQIELGWPVRSRAVTREEAQAAYAAERHLEVIRLAHPLYSLGGRAFVHLL